MFDGSFCALAMAGQTAGNRFRVKMTNAAHTATSMDPQEHAGISSAYLRFADEEAHDRSALYEELARGVASDPSVVAFLLTLSKVKRQPNLLFGATRLLFGTPTGWGDFPAHRPGEWRHHSSDHDGPLNPDE
jgi:hypothetical protein